MTAMQVRLRSNGSRVFEAVYPNRRKIRFLLDDGTIADVVAYKNDSDLREALLGHFGKERSIVGVAEMGEVD